MLLLDQNTRTFTLPWDLLQNWSLVQLWTHWHYDREDDETFLDGVRKVFEENSFHKYVTYSIGAGYWGKWRCYLLPIPVATIRWKGDLLVLGLPFSVSCDIMKTNGIQGEYMTKADTIFKEKHSKIKKKGSGQSRRVLKYKDGRTANSSISQEPLWSWPSKGEFHHDLFVLSVIKSAVKEMLDLPGSSVE